MITKEAQSIARSALVREALKFWFHDQGHIRSPFPNHIQPAVQQRAVTRFSDWLDRLDAKAKDDVNDEILAEKFEEILFEVGIELVETEDERITLLYPFLPRVGDPVAGQGEAESDSVVTARSLASEGDQKFLALALARVPDETAWHTRIELPA